MTHHHLESNHPSGVDKSTFFSVRTRCRGKHTFALHWSYLDSMWDSG